MARATTDIGKMTRVGTAGRRRQPGQIGRQTMLSPEISKRVCDAVKAGNYLSVAAQYAGVGRETLFQWIRKGENPRGKRDDVYVNFVHDLREAEAAAEVAAVLHWRAAMPKDWRSAQTWLAKRAPERWAEVKDPQTATAGAFAGVNLTINANGTPTGELTAQTGIQVPLAELLEAKPELISGTMAFLDQVLPVAPVNGVVERENDATEGLTAQNADPATQTTLEALKYAETAHSDPNSTIIDAEEGSWTSLDDQTSDF